MFLSIFIFLIVFIVWKKYGKKLENNKIIVISHQHHRNKVKGIIKNKYFQVFILIKILIKIMICQLVKQNSMHHKILTFQMILQKLNTNHSFKKSKKVRLV